MAFAEAVALPPAEAPAELRGLLIELNCLKRIRSARRGGSIAERLFAEGWTRIAAGVEPEAVAIATTAAALAAARLGDVDDDVLRSAGLSPPERGEIMLRAIEAVAGQVDATLKTRLLAAVSARPRLAGAPPDFVRLLAAQPRAGLTCPGRARVMLDQPESHAEHSSMVAVYAVLLAPSYGARIGEVFLAALAHHLHNAGLPDSGFAGEELLGDRLEAVSGAFTAHALAELAPPVRTKVERALQLVADAGTPEGQAFHAADVVDRVVEIAGRLAAASLGVTQVIEEMALVHDGPIKPFHDLVLSEMSLP